MVVQSAVENFSPTKRRLYGNQSVKESPQVLRQLSNDGFIGDDGACSRANHFEVAREPLKVFCVFLEHQGCKTAYPEPRSPGTVAIGHDEHDWLRKARGTRSPSCFVVGLKPTVVGRLRDADDLGNATTRTRPPIAKSRHEFGWQRV